MAKVILPEGIESISGTVGGLVFKTYKRRDGKTETRVYSNPFADGWKRRSKLSKKELAARKNFSLMAKEVLARIAAGDKRPRKEIWKEVKEEYAARES